jgi:hypothetical protein
MLLRTNDKVHLQQKAERQSEWRFFYPVERFVGRYGLTFNCIT